MPLQCKVSYIVPNRLSLPKSTHVAIIALALNSFDLARVRSLRHDTASTMDSSWHDEEHLLKHHQNEENRGASTKRNIHRKK